MRTFVAALMLVYTNPVYGMPSEIPIVESTPIVDTKVMLAEATTRIDQGDYIGAKIQLKLVLKALKIKHQLSNNPEHWISGAIDDVGALAQDIQVELLDILYLYAGVLQEEHDLAGAIHLFESLLTHDYTVIRYDDILFRCATAHSQLGNNDQAKATLRQLVRNKSLTKADVAKLRLAKRMFTFRARPSLRGASRLHKQLNRLPEAYFRSYRANLRVELIQHLMDTNEALHFSGNQQQIVRHHRHRSKNHQASVSHLERVIQLQQPVQAAHALFLISTGLMHTGDALHAAPIPDTLSPEQQTIYRAQIQTYVKNTWVNALRYSTEGVHLSTRLNLGEPLKTKMASLKEAISTRIEQLN